MRLRKLGTVVQVGLRLREDLRRKLATAAEDHHRSFNEELTKRLEDSLENEARQTLQDAAQSIAQDALRLRKLVDQLQPAERETPLGMPETLRQMSQQQRNEEGDK